MKTKKLNLSTLKISSFIASINNDERKTINGGAIVNPNYVPNDEISIGIAFCATNPVHVFACSFKKYAYTNENQAAD